jgi:hypothetical protein
MPKENKKMKSWQIFHFARKYLGRHALYACFGKKNARTVEYWCEDPKYTNKPEEAWDPIKGVKLLFTSLDDAGHIGVIRSAVSYLVSDTELADGGCPEHLAEPLPTLSEEILADYRAVADLQAALDRNADIEEVMMLKGEAIAEIERTVAKYREGLWSSQG